MSEETICPTCKHPVLDHTSIGCWIFECHCSEYSEPAPVQAVPTCHDCMNRWSASLEADGPKFEPCPEHRQPAPPSEPSASLETVAIECLEALRVIAHALHDDKGNYWEARQFLRNHNVYEGNIDGEVVLREVAEWCLKHC